MHSLFEKVGSFFIGHLDAGLVGLRLLVDPVQLVVLPADLGAHVVGHVPEVAHHGADLLHVVLHLLLAVVVGDPRHEGALAHLHGGRGLGAAPAASLHLAPHLFVLLETLGFLPKLGEDPEGEVHGLERLLREAHVVVDAVETGLHLVQLLALVVQRDQALDARVLGLCAHVHHAAGGLQRLVRLLVTLELEASQVIVRDIRHGHAAAAVLEAASASGGVP